MGGEGGGWVEESNPLKPWLPGAEKPTHIPPLALRRGITPSLICTIISKHIECRGIYTFHDI